MNSPSSKQRSLVEAFHSLHQSGCFVLPNPWDVGTALYLEHVGFKALATTSAGFAFTQGLPDNPSAMSLELVLGHFQQIAQATSLPVNADFQNGYAIDPEEVALNVARCVQTGVAGLSIEDSTGVADEPLYERSLAIERIRAARRAIDESGVPVVLTARCEAALVNHPDARRLSLDRLAAFADAGADCLYAPGFREAEHIAAIVRAVSPKPVNALVSSPGPDLTVERLEHLGVRRISVGSALSRVAWAAFVNAARSILDTGTFEALLPAEPAGDLNRIFGSRRTVA